MDSDQVLEPNTVLPPLIDCHTHMDQYESRELPDIFQRARDVGVQLIIAAGTTLPSCHRILDLCAAYPMLYAGLGLHPMDLVGQVSDDVFADLYALAQHPRVVVWSETGLDYLPSSPPVELQQNAFRRQIQMAKELDLPLVVHSREADDDMLRLLRDEKAGQTGGAWHYFQSDLATARKAIDLGFYISVAKPVLRLPALQEVIAKLPLKHLVLETDSFPQTFKKHRMRWTEPWHLPQVAQKVAELHHTDIGHIAEATTANALQMLKGKTRGTLLFPS